MSQYFQIHPENPQLRLVRRAVDMVRDGAVIVYPTDSCYAIGCQLDDKAAMERIRRIRQLSPRHNFTLVVRDLSEIATYGKVDNSTFRLLKALTPGPYTFILAATHEVPRRLWNPKRRTIGVRVPDHPIAQALLAELGEPLLSTTLLLPPDDLPLSDPEDIRDRLEREVDLIIDGGGCGLEPSSVIDLEGDTPHIRRVGKGDVSLFQ